MKHEIYCMQCKQRVKEAIGDESELPPGEHVLYVDGKAHNDMVCDFCNEPIYQGQMCSAFSNYNKQAPYIPWEDKYLDIVEQDAMPKIKPMGVYGLLASGHDDQLMAFMVATGILINFVQRQKQTVHGMCMQESLEYAVNLARRLRLTLQYIDHVGDEEVYPVIHQGTHGRWEKGGYVDN